MAVLRPVYVLFSVRQMLSNSYLGYYIRDNIRGVGNVGVGGGGGGGGEAGRRGRTWGGGGEFLYISYIKCLGGDQCKKNLFRKYHLKRPPPLEKFHPTPLNIS